MSEADGYAEIDHTADLGLRVWADTLEGLFHQAARGLADLLTDPATVVPRVERVFELRAIDLEELLVAWLNEILYAWESEDLLLAAIREMSIRRVGDGFALRARAAGETRDPARHPVGEPVKAATYHGLRIVPRADGRYEVTLIFDM